VIGALLRKIKDIYKEQKQLTKEIATSNRKRNKSSIATRSTDYNTWGKFIQTHLGKHISSKDVTQYAKTRMYVAKYFTERELQHAYLDFTTALFLAKRASVIDKNYWIRIAKTKYVSLQDIQSHIGYAWWIELCKLKLFTSSSDEICSNKPSASASGNKPSSSSDETCSSDAMKT